MTALYGDKLVLQGTHLKLYNAPLKNGHLQEETLNWNSRLSRNQKIS
jgi:hypothetical protein